MYAYTTDPGDTGAYYYLTTASWDNYEAFRETVPAKPHKKMIFIDVSTLPAGLYTFLPYNEHTTVFKRILIAH